MAKALTAAPMPAPATRWSRAPMFVGAFVVGAAAAIGSVFLETPPAAVALGNIYAIEPANVEDSRAYKYARLDDEACFASLDSRGFAYKRVDATKGIAAPIRLAGPIHGVTFKLTYRGPGRTTDDDKSAVEHPRLSPRCLAIDDLAALLEKHDVVQAEYLSMYRAQALGLVGPGVRHPAGRAIDLATVTRKDGTTFNVAFDFHGRGVGAKTCGENAAAPLQEDTEGARLLRQIAMRSSATSNRST